jgi:hypothetical protein
MSTLTGYKLTNADLKSLTVGASADPVYDVLTYAVGSTVTGPGLGCFLYTDLDARPSLKSTGLDGSGYRLLEVEYDSGDVLQVNPRIGAGSPPTGPHIGKDIVTVSSCDVVSEITP